MRFIPVICTILISGLIFVQGALAQDSRIEACKRTPQDADGLEGIRREVKQRVNVFREQNGLDELELNRRLNRAAQRYAREIVATGRMNHEGLDGSTPEIRVERAGYKYRWIAENLAIGQVSPAEVIQAWKDSPNHRASMLMKDAEDLGVGFAKSRRARKFGDPSVIQFISPGCGWVLLIARPQ